MGGGGGGGGLRGYDAMPPPLNCWPEAPWREEGGGGGAVWGVREGRLGGAGVPKLHAPTSCSLNSPSPASNLTCAAVW